MTIKASPGRRLVTFAAATPPVRRIPSALARRFDQICTTALAQALAESDLTPVEFAVLPYLSKQGAEPGDPGEPDIDQRGLADRLGIDRNSAGLLAERLETKGLVERRPSTVDRRSRLLRLTKRGETLLRKLHPRALQSQAEVLAVLDPVERELLLDLLVRVIEGNWSMARPGTGRRKRSARTRRRS